MAEDALQTENVGVKDAAAINDDQSPRYNLIIADKSPSARKVLISKIMEVLQDALVKEASDGTQVQELLTTGDCDLVISDIEMPKLDGYKLLQWVREQPRMKLLPFIVHTTFNEASAVKKAIDLGVTDYILKTVSPETLARKIQDNVELVRELVEKKKELVKSISIPPQPQIIMELDTEINKPDPDMKKIIDLVKKDIALTTKVMKVANSPFFSSTKVSTIDRAMAVLGLKEFHKTVVLSSIQNALGGGKHVSDEFWKHSMLNAEIVRFIAEKKGSEYGFISPQPAKIQEFENQAYLTGLLHDCGMVLMLNKFDNYDIDKFLKMNKDIVEHEDGEYYTNHCSLAAIMLRQWGLPELVCEAIRYHHGAEVPEVHLSEGLETRPLKKLWSVIQLADYMISLYLASVSCDLESDNLWAQAHASAMSELNLESGALKTLKLTITEFLLKREKK
ncbi:MAG: HDOD domain-containing protein [Nitrospirae bacterium]|nr:HDOD domain-containing protein [Nitrospirota bacterium]